MWNFTKSLNGLKEYVPESDHLLPILYLTGAAGSLAYGTYALVGHVRDGRKANSALNIARVAAPLVVGSGLVVLGVRSIWINDDRPTAQAEESKPSRRGRRSQMAAKARRARASNPQV